MKILTLVVQTVKMDDGEAAERRFFEYEAQVLEFYRVTNMLRMREISCGEGHRRLSVILRAIDIEYSVSELAHEVALWEAVLKAWSHILLNFSDTGLQLAPETKEA